jgi:hypothetical protein
MCIRDRLHTIPLAVMAPPPSLDIVTSRLAELGVMLVNVAAVVKVGKLALISSLVQLKSNNVIIVKNTVFKIVFFIFVILLIDII